MSWILELLPPGLLPKWMLLISAASLANSVRMYLGDDSLAKSIYTGRPEMVTPLSNRTFGTWFTMIAIVRVLAAYNLHNPTIYTMVQSSYCVAALHFGSELLVFKTAKLGDGFYKTVVVMAISLTWMSFQRSYYVN